MSYIELEGGRRLTVAAWNDLPEIDRLRESNRILTKRLRELDAPNRVLTDRLAILEDACAKASRTEAKLRSLIATYGDPDLKKIVKSLCPPAGPKSKP
jgi:hypothetical protein